MIDQRPAELQAFIDAAATAVAARVDTLPQVQPLAEKIFTTLSAAEAEVTNVAPSRTTVCKYFEPAIDIAKTTSTELAGLAEAFAAVEPQLAWKPKVGSEDYPNDFANRHANTVFVGHGGIEHSDEVRIGASLVAPNTNYPRHQHAPEEFYIVLSPGAWMNGDRPMVQKDSGDLVHNNPLDWHAMSAGDVPLLAIWCLWTADT